VPVLAALPGIGNEPGREPTGRCMRRGRREATEKDLAS
jgi:hypothetical protein